MTYFEQMVLGRFYLNLLRTVTAIVNGAYEYIRGTDPSGLNTIIPCMGFALTQKLFGVVDYAGAELFIGLALTTYKDQPVIQSLLFLFSHFMESGVEHGFVTEGWAKNAVKKFLERLENTPPYRKFHRE